LTAAEAGLGKREWVSGVQCGAGREGLLCPPLVMLENGGNFWHATT